jgi:hypothetical protein
MSEIGVTDGGHNHCVDRSSESVEMVGTALGPLIWTEMCVGASWAGIFSA